MRPPVAQTSRRDAGLTPSMMPLVRQALAAVGAAVVGAVLLYLFLVWLLALPLRPKDPGDQARLADLVKVALGLAAGVGASVALIVGYRKARVEESASHRDDQRLFDDRYQSAAELLGHDTAAVRLAGVYAMARLADDWAEQRQQCIDVLCAYLRLPYDPDLPEGGENELRLSLVHLMVGHLVPGAPISWSGELFDFSRATLDGCSFDDAVFERDVTFAEARFIGRNTSFDGAIFRGYAAFDGCTVDAVSVTFYLSEFRRRATFGPFALSDGARLDFTATLFVDTLQIWGATIHEGASLAFYGSYLKGGLSLNGSQVLGQVTFEDSAIGELEVSSSGRIELDDDTFDTRSLIEFRGCVCTSELVVRSTLRSDITLIDTDLTRAGPIRIHSELDHGEVVFERVTLGSSLSVVIAHDTGLVELTGLTLTASAPEPEIDVAGQYLSVRRPAEWPRVPDPTGPASWQRHGRMK